MMSKMRDFEEVRLERIKEEEAKIKRMSNEELIEFLIDRYAAGHTSQVRPTDDFLKSEILSRMTKQ